MDEQKDRALVLVPDSKTWFQLYSALPDRRHFRINIQMVGGSFFKTNKHAGPNKHTGDNWFCYFSPRFSTIWYKNPVKNWKKTLNFQK